MNERYSIAMQDDGLVISQGGKTVWTFHSRSMYDSAHADKHAYGAIRQLAADLAERDAETAALKARLAEIDRAPTRAVSVEVYTDRGPYRYLSFKGSDVPEHGTELIARPKKESGNG